MANSGFWDGVLRILRDPIFALVFALFLTFLGTRAGRRLARTVCWLAAVVILIWLAAHNASSAHVEIAVVTDITRVLLIFIAVLFAVALIALAVLLIMYLKSGPAPSPSPVHRYGGRSYRPFTGHEFTSLGETAVLSAADLSADERVILEEGGHLEQQLNQVTELLMDLLEGVDVDNPGQAVAAVMRTYTSGLSAHSAEIRALHERCTASIARITSVLVKSHDVRLLRRMANKHWFPTATEWAAVAGEIDLGLPYFGLRLLCLKKDWRAVVMVMCKSSVSLMLLLDMDLDEL